MDNFDMAAQALAARSVDDLSLAMGEFFEGRSDPLDLPAWAHFAVGAGAAPPEVSEQTAPFLDNIARLRHMREIGGVRQPEPSHLRIGVDFDFIGDPSLAYHWSPVQYINFVLMSGIRPTRRAAVVVAMRDDGIYVIEWIAHYLSLGFEHIFIYTNDNADGSEILLGRLASHGVITLIESETAGKVPPETKAFEHTVHLMIAARDFEWLLFADSDEYLMPAPRFGNKIQHVLAELTLRHPEDAPSAILYNWLWYVSGMAFERRPGMLIERFQHAESHTLTKTFVRLADLYSMQAQHIPLLRRGRTVVNSAFEFMDPDSAFHGRAPCYEGGWLAHFWPKSFQEFSLKKARGDTLDFEDNAYSRPFELFFQWNRAEEPSNHFPPDAEFVAAVKRKAASLRQLRGVATAEANVNDRFESLIGRYDDIGGLRQIYDRSRREPGHL